MDDGGPQFDAEWRRWPSSSVNSDLLKEVAQQYKDKIDDVEWAATRKIRAAHKAHDSELARYHNQVALSAPVTDEVGILLGKIREIAHVYSIARLDELIDNLELELNKQLVGFYRTLMEKDLVQVTPVQPHKTSVALAQLAVEKKAAADKAAARASFTPSPPPFPAGLHHPTPPSAAKCEADSPKNSSKVAAAAKCDEATSISYTTGLIAEAIARRVRAETVRIYLAEGGTNVKWVTSFPPEFPNHFSGVNNEPQLSRLILSAVFHRGIAVAGHDLQNPLSMLQSASSSRYLKKEMEAGTLKKKKRKGGQGEDEEEVAVGGKTCLYWPIRSLKGAEQAKTGKQTATSAVALGVIEVLNKDGYTPEERQKFTDKDEEIVNGAAVLFAAMMEGHGVDSFCKVNALFGGIGSSSHRPSRHASQLVLPTHLPLAVAAPISEAEAVANSSIRFDGKQLVFRGPSSSIQKKITGQKPSEMMKSVGASTSDLVSVEYALDSLNAMWKLGYEENVTMHEQCRTWAKQVKELNSITKSFQDALIAARGIRNMEDLQLFLRTVELAIKSQNAKNVREVVEKGIEEVKREEQLQHTTGGNSSHENSASKRSSPIQQQPQPKKRDLLAELAELQIDGPVGVRTYTVDVEAKKEQLRLISEIVAESQARAQRELEEATYVPPHMQMTETHSKKQSRVGATVFSVPSPRIGSAPQQQQQQRNVALSSTPMGLRPTTTNSTWKSARK